jgi:hypothetical protein
MVWVRMPIEPCPLCATHGDVWNPGLTECRFIGQEINVDGRVKDEG